MRSRLAVVGIDEVGRGPLAGPLTVGVLVIPRRHLWHLEGVKDSKKLAPAAREAWYEKIRALEKEGILASAVAFVGERQIDRKGLSHSLMKGVARCLRRLEVPLGADIRLDGSLYAPPVYLRQKTIVRGDEKELAIAAASILAKVRRDRRMRNLARRYPGYGFEAHKGYGTSAHYRALRKLGLSRIHRRSFLKGLARS